MLTVEPMGRKKLGRVRHDITLPPDISEKANAAALAEGKAFSHLVEELLRLYLSKISTNTKKRKR